MFQQETLRMAVEASLNGRHEVATEIVQKVKEERIIRKFKKLVEREKDKANNQLNKIQSHKQIRTEWNVCTLCIYSKFVFYIYTVLYLFIICEIYLCIVSGMAW